ncbi:MAG: dTDP-4-dehydrorhamnose reductase [Nitrospinae bacterium]|nr:dTDP-4-dehydrorhamnose reductase [Nitrospinota bacterium]
MKILVTGAKGMLGSDLLNILSSCSPLTTGERIEVRGAARSDFDITDYPQTIRFLTDTKPNIVIHTAGYTKVDDCESHSETALKVNAEGTKNVAIGCKEIKAKLIYISTDYIFNGKKGTPYLEDDIPSPISVYGDSKLKGEQAVQDILKDFIIIRTSWLFGNILRQTDKNKIIKVVNDQKGSPTYTIDLSHAIEKLISYSFSSPLPIGERGGVRGIFNITNSGECSWYQFTKKILEFAEIKGVEVMPITSEELNRPARRPVYSVLDCSKFKNTANYQIRHWEDALKDYLNR